MGVKSVPRSFLCNNDALSMSFRQCLQNLHAHVFWLALLKRCLLRIQTELQLPSTLIYLRLKDHDQNYVFIKMIGKSISSKELSILRFYCLILIVSVIKLLHFWIQSRGL